MEDFIIRGVDRVCGVRFAVAQTTEMAAKAVVTHDADPQGAGIAIDAATLAALMSILIEDDEKYSIRWEYPGAASVIWADVNAAGDVRVCPSQPRLAEFPQDVDSIYGKEDGNLAVTRSENGKILNSGHTTAPLGSLAGDLAFFLSTSDQVETEIVTAYTFNADPANPVATAAGFMMQALPGCDLEKFAPLRELIVTNDFRKELAESPVSAEKWVRGLLCHAFNVADDNINARFNYDFAAPIDLRCHCNKEKMQAAINLLDPKEIEEIIANEGAVKIQCRFCRQQYSFAAPTQSTGDSSQ